MPTRSARAAAALSILVAVMAVAVRSGEAHKPITSKYTYNNDVFPIVQVKCSRCHVDGGVAPMSLMTYEEAFPWAESIRAELIASHMPPWLAEGTTPLKHANLLTAHELDVLLTWATGGNPQGRLDQKLPKVTLKNDWTIGPPDLKLTLPEYTLAADTMEAIQEFTVATGLKEARWIRAADLLPDTPSVVRSAIVAVKGGGDAAMDPERVLARWLPGQGLESVDHDDAGFKLPANAELTVRVHFKKTWQLEGKPVNDASTVGLYFASERTTRELLVVPVAAPADAQSANQQLKFSQTLDEDVAVLAVAADAAPPNITIQAWAVLPDGKQTSLVRLLTRADWVRCYWFEKPIALPRGTKIEVVANLQDPDLFSAAYGGPAPPKAAVSPLPLRLALEVIRAPTNSSAPKRQPLINRGEIDRSPSPAKS